MKRIAIVCDYVLKPNRIGGMDRFFKLFDEKLKDRGCVIDWYFTDSTSFDFYKNLNIYSANNSSVEDKFIESSKDKNYDIIITHFTEMCTKFYKKFKEFNPKAHIIAVDHNPRPLNGFSIKKRIKKRLEGVLYSRYINQFIGVSKYTVKHILNDYGGFLKNKTKVVYNGIDVNVFKKREESNVNKFIVASHLRYSKGIQDLLKALSYLDIKILNGVVIDIYGEGPYKNELINLTSNYKLSDIVNFKGSSPVLHKLFSKYSYMIQPTYMECFSLSILESLSANVPVITTTVGGNLEVILDGSNGFIYETGNVKSLSVLLENIITKKKLITSNTSVLIEQYYNIDKMVDDYIKLLPCT